MFLPRGEVEFFQGATNSRLSWATLVEKCVLYHVDGNDCDWRDICRKLAKDSNLSVIWDSLSTRRRKCPEFWVNIPENNLDLCRHLLLSSNNDKSKWLHFGDKVVQQYHHHHQYIKGDIVGCQLKADSWSALTFANWSYAAPYIICVMLMITGIQSETFCHKIKIIMKNTSDR